MNHEGRDETLATFKPTQRLILHDRPTRDSELRRNRFANLGVHEMPLTGKDCRSWTLLCRQSPDPKRARSTRFLTSYRRTAYCFEVSGRHGLTMKQFQKLDHWSNSGFGMSVHSDIQFFESASSFARRQFLPDRGLYRRISKFQRYSRQKVNIYRPQSAANGPAVVMLHGSPKPAKLWAPLDQALYKNHTVIVPDLCAVWALSSQAERRLATRRTRQRTSHW